MDAPTTVIEATSVSMKTLVDGTLRLTVEIEPNNALSAFALFRAPGTVIALAAIQRPQEGDE